MSFGLREGVHEGRWFNGPVLLEGRVWKQNLLIRQYRNQLNLALSSIFDLACA